MSREITAETFDPNDEFHRQYVADRPWLVYELSVAGVSLDGSSSDEDESNAEDEGDGDEPNPTQGDPGRPTTVERPSDTETVGGGDTPPESEEEEEEVDLEELTIPELKELLKERSLAVGGTKDELIARLVEHENNQ